MDALDSRLRLLEREVTGLAQAQADNKEEVQEIKTDIGDIKKWVLGTLISAVLGLCAALWELSLRLLK